MLKRKLAAAALLLVAMGGAWAGAQTLPASEPNLRMTNDVRVYQAVKDAVVNISSTRIVAQRASSGDPVFDRFFGGGNVQLGPAQSLGTGFVIHSSGYIITNEHVIDQAFDIKVKFSSGKEYDAKVIATDNEHDLAVIKVEPDDKADSKKGFQTIPLGTSEGLMIGEPVYAIGNPLGYAGTMTRGIVSAVDRTIEAGASPGTPGRKYTGLIQTDASINPGNSGGPLLNAYGQVVGINSAIRADAHGIGFAIAVSSMRDLLPAFLNAEAVSKAQIGFTIEEKRGEKPPAVVESIILVKSVQAKSSAEKAGLKAGDQLLSVGDAPVANVVDALVALNANKPGDTIDLRIARAGKKVDLKVMAAKMPVGATEEILLAKLGIKGETVTPGLAVQRKLAIIQGIYITAVKADSPAGTAGLQPGDVLVQLGRAYITSVDQLANGLKQLDKEIELPIGIVRGNSRGRGAVTIK